MAKKQTAIVPIERAESKILLIRDRKVILDSDLALLYGVTTSRLNEQVKRNIERFPDDFMFQLTKTEFDIISLLARTPNQVFTRARLLDQVRDDNYPITERVVDYQVTSMRKKLGKAGEYIKTVRGVGYKFET